MTIGASSREARSSCWPVDPPDILTRTTDSLFHRSNLVRSRRERECHHRATGYALELALTDSNVVFMLAPCMGQVSSGVAECFGPAAGRQSASDRDMYAHPPEMLINQVAAQRVDPLHGKGPSTARVPRRTQCRDWSDIGSLPPRSRACPPPGRRRGRHLKSIGTELPDGWAPRDGRAQPDPWSLGSASEGPRRPRVTQHPARRRRPRSGDVPGTRIRVSGWCL